MVIFALCWHYSSNKWKISWPQNILALIFFSQQPKVRNVFNLDFPDSNHLAKTLTIVSGPDTVNLVYHNFFACKEKVTQVIKYRIHSAFHTGNHNYFNYLVHVNHIHASRNLLYYRPLVVCWWLFRRFWTKIIFEVDILVCVSARPYIRTGPMTFWHLLTMLPETTRADKSSWRKCEGTSCRQLLLLLTEHRQSHSPTRDNVTLSHVCLILDTSAFPYTPTRTARSRWKSRLPRKQLESFDSALECHISCSHSVFLQHLQDVPCR